jgi:DNA-binding phage protein
MMTLEQVQAALKDRNLQAVSQSTGLAAHTLYRISKGKNKPHMATLKIISDYLDPKAQKNG